jgi:phosphoglucosamine mutase
MAERRLFGTDGIRARAGVAPLDTPTIRRVGAALGDLMHSGSQPVRMLIGRDTRESGEWIERELAHGARSSGAEVVSTGVLPTPAIASATERHGYSLGVVISASHNLFEDNGIKVFSCGGEKFTEADERRVELLVADPARPTPPGDAPVVRRVDHAPDYLAHLRRILPEPEAVRGLRIAVDCANGAAVSIAPALFTGLGVDAHVIGCEPDGRNINAGVGSTAPERLVAAVIAGSYRLGVAFDGDGDRAIFVDAHGRVVDGDAVMLLCAVQMQAEGRLRGGAIVATVMSNIGLELALKAAGIDLVRCPVGDKHVMEELLARNLAFGGEQSGHVIFADDLSTGDGLATALHVLRTMLTTDRELADLVRAFVAYPQVLVNLRVPELVDLATVPEIVRVMASVEARLAGRGRLLVRYSGTEPLLRIMLEGQDQQEIRDWAQEIVGAVQCHFAAVSA